MTTCWRSAAHIPLEQCLSEAREAGFVGMELGNKFPRTAEQLQPILEAHGHALVSGWYSCELLQRDAAAEMQRGRRSCDAAPRHGLPGDNCLRNVQYRPGPAGHAAFGAAGAGDDALGRIRPASDGIRRAAEGDLRPATGLSPPYGNRRADRGRDRPADGDDRPGAAIFCSTPAMSPGVAAIRPASRAITATASAMCIARTSARR